jgi:two-component system chemotaxis sensor kinase CheA
MNPIEERCKMDSITRIFFQEALDLLEDLDLLLLDVEENPASSELLDQFMGKVHTFKGSSATVGLMEMSDLSHKIEDLTQLLCTDRIGPSPGFFDLLSQAIDVLRRSVTNLGEGHDESPELSGMKEVMESWHGSAIGNASDNRDASGDMAQDLPLGEYDYVRIASLKKAGKDVYKIDVIIASMHQDPVKRGEQLLDKAQKMGDVIFTDPPEWEFDSLVETGKLTILSATYATPEEIQQQLAPLADGIPRVEPFGEAPKQKADPGPGVPRSLVTERTVRVETGELEELLRLVGELVTTRARFQNIATEFRQILGDPVHGLHIEETAAHLEQIA